MYTLTIDELKEVFPQCNNRIYVVINGETYDLVETKTKQFSFVVDRFRNKYEIRVISASGQHFWLEKVYKGKYTLNSDFAYSKKYATKKAAQTIIEKMKQCDTFDIKNGQF